MGRIELCREHSVARLTAVYKMMIFKTVLQPGFSCSALHRGLEARTDTL